MNLYYISYRHTPINIESKLPDGRLTKDARDTSPGRTSVIAADAETAVTKLREYYQKTSLVQTRIIENGVPFKESYLRRVDTILSVENLGAIDIL